MTRKQTEKESGASRAETRARVRRWSRVEEVSQWILLAGTVAFVASVPVGIGLAIWFWIAGVDRFDVFAWLYGSGVGVLLIGVGLDTWAGSRLTEARFADGRCTVGVIEEVIVLPGNDADGNPVYDLVVRAELPGRPALRRTVSWGSGDSAGPDDRWAGRAIRFRHNTLDPDDEHDVLFDGWPDDRKKSRR
ncbi:hypothetical protein [Streptomyces sp. NRRL F-5065]|uniref:hypothetical protein n=1 Tax=Streptomyces sp. NRRL F-5065 TaxID=1463855 RepID=UPI0004C245D5|nr:hypothetical protein [Streptomyces sp. NRRL F-5065]